MCAGIYMPRRTLLRLHPSTRCNARPRKQLGGVHIEQIASPLDSDVRQRVELGIRRAKGVVALAGKHRRQAVAEDGFHRCQQPLLVIDHDVLAHRMVPLNRFCRDKRAETI